ncbi:hypothetical protein C1646_707849 [Rhizophagus diaphanus]|nr:hypothetical protein C1646_707849 [Rhizophagus diaphanus] [Rhizophagus sp. MUCL 43196]
MSRMNKLFFCIPQEVGAVIIPLLWLITGVIVIVKFTLDFCSSVKGTNMFAYSSVYTILIMAICGLTIIGAAIILYILACAKTPNMISVYFIITVVIGIIIIMGNIAALVEFIVHKTTILGRCSNNNNLCDNAYGDYLATAIFSTVISIFLSVHFVVVINDYKHKQNGTGPYAV